VSINRINAVDAEIDGKRAMTSERVRIVLAEGVVEDQLITLAGRHKWWVHDRHARKGEEPAEYVYVTRDGGSFLHWIEDHKLGVNYILVNGPATSQIVQILREQLSNFSPAYIMKHVRETELSPVDRRMALYHLALDKMDHGFDQETFDIFSKALRDPDPFVRGSAVLGSAYLGWPRLAEPLRALANHDEPDESIRRDAATLVNRLGASAAKPS
jgi:hypothetical protein